MGLGSFFKKKQDDFSDMDLSSKGELPHMGLPADGDITNTNPFQSGSPYGEPQPSYGVSNPEAFSKMGLQEAADKYTQQSSARPMQMGTMQQDSDSGDKLKLLDKDMQVINAKLDMLKSLIEGMNQRLVNIEKLADDGKKEEKIRW